MLIKFTTYHVRLILYNKTTIGDLAHKWKAYISQYDCGFSENMYAVFGLRKWTWPFPFYLNDGLPKGDGIRWMMRRKWLRDRGQENDVGGDSSEEEDEESR